MCGRRELWYTQILLTNLWYILEFIKNVLFFIQDFLMRDAIDQILL